MKLINLFKPSVQSLYKNRDKLDKKLKSAFLEKFPLKSEIEFNGEKYLVKGHDLNLRRIILKNINKPGTLWVEYDSTKLS